MENLLVGHTDWDFSLSLSISFSFPSILLSS